MKNFYERYKHAIPLMVYAVIYCVWFAWLEKKVINPPFIIHMKIDDRIPFLEVFVIPYFLWFAYVSAAVLYCFFKNKQEYFNTCVFLFTGMTVFLVISTLCHAERQYFIRPCDAFVPRGYSYEPLAKHPCVQFYRRSFGHRAQPKACPE